ncbi:TMBIM6 [Lepeophtheirus salmonis]|uniref:TMBIM6 n=1 Tax=Lepeophtheirus salmonis TaxID=72036 RepID=A0A7R8CQ32_LEPSM|nr:TMBIM6 [Lepeophtheirus salmonis]CAF2858798.1 TMBIM6 [Lepeophtheirus salmonis]
MSSSISGMFQNYHLRLDAPVKKHLKNVYACLGLSVTSFAVGGYVQMYSSFLSTHWNRLQRLSMLLGFAFLNGVGFGPLMSMAMMKNPAIIPSSFLMGNFYLRCFHFVVCSELIILAVPHLLFCTFLLNLQDTTLGWTCTGDKDFIRHSVDLFIDFVNILKDIMIILMDKEKPRDKKKTKIRNKKKIYIC